MRCTPSCTFSISTVSSANSLESSAAAMPSCFKTIRASIDPLDSFTDRSPLVGCPSGSELRRFASDSSVSAVRTSGQSSKDSFSSFHSRYSGMRALSSPSFQGSSQLSSVSTMRLTAKPSVRRYSSDVILRPSRQSLFSEYTCGKTAAMRSRALARSAVCKHTRTQERPAINRNGDGI